MKKLSTKAQAPSVIALLHCRGNMDVATTTCTTSGSTQTCVTFEATSSPIYVQDSGDVQYMLAWILFWVTIAGTAFLWNTFRRY